MPVVMHFATFLKLLTQDTGDKIRDLEKYGRPGGYDFWRPLRDGMDGLVGHGRLQSKVQADIAANASANSKKRNLEVFDQAAEWFAKQAGTGFFPNRGVWKSPAGMFSVQIEPEIGLEKKNGQQLVAAIYGRAAPRIRRDQAGAAIILLERTYKSNADIEFGILDAAAGKLHKAKSNVSEALLEAETKFIDEQLARVMA